MAFLYLIPWPETPWSASGRLPGRTPLSLTDAGRQAALQWAESIGSGGLGAVYCSNEQASLETAKIFARATGAKLREHDGIEEVDAGLWDGLTQAELKRRYPRIYKRWCTDPSAVCPPEGEKMEGAIERIQAAMDEIIGRIGDRPGAVVLGPLAFAAARCLMEGGPVAELHEKMNSGPQRFLLPDGDVVVPGKLAS